MKTLLTITLLAAVAITCQAQSRNNISYSKMNLEQLTLALQRSETKISSGIVVTFVGSVMIVSGGIMVHQAKNETGFLGGLRKEITGGGFMIVGGITSIAGIVLWNNGSNAKKKITLEMVRFSPSAAGIGLRIQF